MALRLAVLLSGSGTTLENLIACTEKGTLDAEIAVVISLSSGSSERAGGAFPHTRSREAPMWTIGASTTLSTRSWIATARTWWRWLDSSRGWSCAATPAVS